MYTADQKAIIEAVKSEIVLTMEAMLPEIEKTVAKNIEKTVNGKINAMREVLDEHFTGEMEHRAKVDEFMEMMKPAKKALWTLAALREFAVWISGFGIIGTIIYLGIKELMHK